MEQGMDHVTENEQNPMPRHFMLLSFRTLWIKKRSYILLERKRGPTKDQEPESCQISQQQHCSLQYNEKMH